MIDIHAPSRAFNLAAMSFGFVLMAGIPEDRSRNACNDVPSEKDAGLIEQIVSTA
jgi:hypothetical protein